MFCAIGIPTVDIVVVVVITVVLDWVVVRGALEIVVVGAAITACVLEASIINAKSNIAAQNSSRNATVSLRFLNCKGI